ncbi:hypothetical protein [Hydrogenothermus marinus]|uniref:Uncharacterized protein n=1 Tax=Hydrogenothermus marinus TaxID=133270 RepID=A0A3M0BNF9_9AQUI|nr:hypothetical protein [Hydrogenothermus marinus]RMA92552.1 hypothetical protein CLV39_1601 [Hydrogenothermus marinus]
MSWEYKDVKLKGIAVDVLSDEWIEEDVINKAPVEIYKIAKRKGGFTLFMKSPTEDLEWYFSKGLTEIKLKQGKTGKYLHIEHEDGIYWVDMQINKEVYEFLKEFIQEQE